MFSKTQQVKKNTVSNNVYSILPLFKKIAYANSGRTHITKDSGFSKERNCMTKEQEWAGGREICIVHTFVPFEF